MKFIIPQNYNFSKKFLGIISYQSIIIDTVWCGIIYILIDFLIKSLNVKIFVFIILTMPVLIFSIAGLGGENLLNVIIYIFKYIFKQKIYFYDKKQD